MDGPDIGELQSIVIRSDCIDRQDGWLLEHVRVSIRPIDGSAETVSLPCNQWLRCGPAGYILSFSILSSMYFT